MRKGNQNVKATAANRAPGMSISKKYWIIEVIEISVIGNSNAC
jgi:hypothetical protein